MHLYSIHITWSEEDQCFTAAVPELVGCSVVGSTHEAALAAIAAGKPPPAKPKKKKEEAASSDAVEAAADGLAAATLDEAGASS